jgi:hypothetical protein
MILPPFTTPSDHLLSRVRRSLGSDFGLGGVRHHAGTPVGSFNKLTQVAPTAEDVNVVRNEREELADELSYEIRRLSDLVIFFFSVVRGERSSSDSANSLRLRDEWFLRKRGNVFFGVIATRVVNKAVVVCE